MSRAVVRSAFTVLALLFSSSARAADGPAEGFTCEQVRIFVSTHGRLKALAIAIEQGATVAQIKAARQCLTVASERR